MGVLKWKTGQTLYLPTCRNASPIFHYLFYYIHTAATLSLVQILMKMNDTGRAYPHQEITLPLTYTTHILFC